MARSFPNDPEKRLDGFLFAKLSNFLQSHSLRLQLLDSNSVTEARSAFEARKGKIGGKKGGLEGLLAAAMMMKGNDFSEMKFTSVLKLLLNFILRYFDGCWPWRFSTVGW